jgi:hypothetical protein
MDTFLKNVVLRGTGIWDPGASHSSVVSHSSAKALE